MVPKQLKKNKVNINMKGRSAGDKAKFVTDFIPTISDSESDIPNLDSEDEVKKDDLKSDPSTDVTMKKKKKKTKAIKKEDTSNKKVSSDTEVLHADQNISNDLNPDFIFAVDDFGSNTAFNGWDFGGDEKDPHAVTKKEVDLDDIIKRKGGLTGKIDVNGHQEENDAAKDQEESHSSDDERNEEDDENDLENVDDAVDDEESDQEEYEDAQEHETNNDDDDDDELAMDGFGMGAQVKVDEESTNKIDEEEQSDQDSTDSSEEPNGVDEENDLSSGEIDEESDPDADSAEAIAEFYDQAEGDVAKEQAHKTFQSLNLSRPVLKALTALNYSTPTPIQSASIPIGLLGRDIVAGAVTGSGKTAAYMIPIIERLLYKQAKVAKTRVIVLTPTRELAIQVADVGRKLGQYVHNFSIGLAVGGLNLRQQEQELKKRPDVVIATPGRLIDHIRNSPSFSVDDVEIVVMDEADRMLEEGFEKEMQEIVELLPRKRQTMLFSATMNSSIKQLISWSLDKPVRIMIDPPKTSASGLVQEFVRVRKREELKPALLYTILSKLDSTQRTIVFISTKDMCHKLRIKLGLLGLRVGELHGGLSQEQRLKSVTQFKNCVVPILLCTDLAARGLDIPKIEVVINFDMPKSHDIYLHRVGRTARAGRDGISISFVGEAKRERSIVKDVIKNVEESGKGKAVGRNADWDEIDRVNKILESKKDLIDEIVEEEKQEKAVLTAEMELKKGENMLKYKAEIESRPKRTWFMTETEKKQEKNKVLDALARTKKPNSKKRKRDEAVADAGGRSYKKTGSDRKVNDVKRINKINSKKTSKNGKKPRRK